jgi:hypothetical protein
MAATIARATGFRRSGDTSTVTRLGSAGAFGEAATWRTFAQAHVNPDGSGYIRVIRDDRTIHRFDFGPEEER